MKIISCHANKLLSILLCITIFLTGCNSQREFNPSATTHLASQSGSQRMVFSSETIVSTEQLGTAMYITKSGQNIFIGGSMKNPTLAKYNLETGEIDMLNIDYSYDDVKLIYAMTSNINQDVYLLTGDLPDYYILDDEMVNNQNRQKIYCLLAYDTNGSFINRVPLPSLDSSMPNGVLIDKKDNVICWDESNLYVFNLNGDELFRLDSSNEQIMNVGFYKGNFLIHVLKNDKTGIYKLDMSERSWGNFTVDKEPTTESNMFQGTNIDDDMYLINTGTEIKKYNPDTGDYELLFSCLDLGIQGSDVTSLIFVEEKNKYYFLNGNSNKIGAIKGELKNISDIQTLKLAVGYSPLEIDKLIGAFKKAYPEYEIEVVTYEGPDGADILLTEIISGNAPDLLDMESLELSPYVEKKMLEDLNKYLNDSDIDFIPNILGALELDGKLYSLPSSFRISTFITELSLVPNKTQWTLEEMNEIFNYSGKEHKFESFITKNELLIYVCRYFAENSVNYNEGTCSFDNEEFINWLELCNEMNESYDSISDPEEYDSYALLRTCWVENFDSVHNPARLYGDNYTYIGFPDDNSNGALFRFPDVRLAMSNQSQHKEAAWKFISTILTEEYQYSTQFFPISQSVFDKRLALSIDRNKKGEEGLTEADAEKLTNLINSTTTADKHDFPLQEIIMEEAAYYFNGAKTAEETVHNIQSRSSIFLAEQN